MNSTDIVIGDLAASELAWRERYIAERSFSVIYRQVAVAGFDALREAQAKIEKLTRNLERERQENGRLREAIIEREDGR